MAVTKIVLQQLGHFHVIAKGHAVEPRRQGFGFLGAGCSGQRGAGFTSVPLECRRRSLGPV
jgi:hypothetical protein